MLKSNQWNRSFFLTSKLWRTNNSCCFIK